MFQVTAGNEGNTRSCLLDNTIKMDGEYSFIMLMELGSGRVSSCRLELEGEEKKQVLGEGKEDIGVMPKDMLVLKLIKTTI